MLLPPGRLALRLADRWLIDPTATTGLPPLFIIGAPRTGSTLFSQCLTNCFQVSFIDNLMAVYPQAMAVTARLSRWIYGKRAHGTFTSAHGATKGWHGPSECGEFWYRWFPRDPVYAPAGSLSEQSLSELRANIAAIVNVWNLPLVVKNMYCAMRLGPLSEAFPNAMFLWCKRNPLQCARSILQTRERIYGDRRTWWSMKPKEFDAIRDHHPCDQVVEQIYYIEKQIEADLAAFFSDKQLFSVQHERFCEDPRSVLDHARDWLAAGGIAIQERGPVPERFRLSPGVALHADDEIRLDHAIRRYYPEHHPHRVAE